MGEIMSKESFLLFKSFYEPTKHLSKTHKGELYEAIFEYQINAIEPKKESLIYPFFLFFKNQFRLDELKYGKRIKANKANGLLGGRPKNKITQNNPNNPMGLKEAKKGDNVNVNVNVNEKDNEKDKKEEKDVQIQKNNFSDFNIFWENYTPIETLDGKATSKGSKQTAFTSYKKAIAKHTPEVIIDGLERYLKHCQANSILTCGATVFLNQERFLNDETVVIKAANRFPPKETTAEIYNSLLKKYENEENENAN